MSHKQNSKRSQTVKKCMEGLEINKLSIDSALENLRKIPSAKFDESIELAFHLGIDTKQADQQIRGTAILPAGTGKKIKVAVIAQGEFATQAKNAGADLVGDKDLLKDIESGKIEFDKLLATLDMMKDVGKLGRILGPRGLMPNPKDGTVTNDIVNAVENIKKGRQINFRAEKEGGVVHLSVGKKSFSNDDLIKNIKEAFLTLQKMKPSSAKGVFFKSIYIKSTMSPAFELDASKII